MDMPKPTAAHLRLNKLIGRWSGSEKMAPGPWAPEGGTALGRYGFRMEVSPDGRAWTTFMEGSYTRVG